MKSFGDKKTKIAIPVRGWLSYEVEITSPTTLTVSILRTTYKLSFINPHSMIQFLDFLRRGYTIVLGDEPRLTLYNTYSENPIHASNWGIIQGSYQVLGEDWIDHHNAWGVVGEYLFSHDAVIWKREWDTNYETWDKRLIVFPSVVVDKDKTG